MRSDDKKLRIGIDGRYLGGPLTGIPRYIHELCLELDRQLPDAQFIVYAQKSEGINLPSSRWTLRTERNQLFAKIKPNLWLKLRLGRLIEKDSLNVFWAAAGLLAGFSSKVPQVLTVYDFTFRLYPETMSSGNLWAYRLFFSRDLRRAQRVVAISEGTNRRMHAYYGRLADAIVRPEAAERFRPATAADCEEVRQRYGINTAFILAVSTLEPRKNFPALIDAFLQLKRAGDLPNHELVLIGKKGWRDTKLAQQIAEQEGQQIRTLGFVHDDDLPAIYTCCDVFCMPSLYEGFGMPVLEALKCGATVVATDTPELREAGGANCFYSKPDAVSISKAVMNSLRATKVKSGIATDGWPESARNLKTVLLSQVKIST